MKIKLMTSPSLNIFFYSKYVPRCVELMRQLDLEKIFVFCVDNASVRSKIINDHKWNIRSVPSLLQIYEDGSSKIFTNDNDILNLFSIHEEVDEEPPNEEGNHEEAEYTEEEEHQNEDENESNNLKTTNTSSSVSISNIVQKMQRERENDDNVLKIAMKDGQ